MKYCLLLLSGALVTGCHSDHDDATPVPSGPALHSVTWYFQDQEGEFNPGEKTLYEYSSGKIQYARQYSYDSQEEKFVLNSTDYFTYRNHKLVFIEKHWADASQVKTTEFEYQDGKVSRIVIDDEVDTEADVQYVDEKTVEVFYNHSNGRSFTYRFSTTAQNIVFEETLDDAHQKSSAVTHEYDAGINPYSLLGYIDPFFTNYSKSNKIKTESEYFGGGFPESVPVAYEYEYNANNLPTQQIITYKSYSHGNISGKAKVVFEYEE